MTNHTIKVERDIPLPTEHELRQRERTSTVYPFADLVAVGDSFAVPYERYQTPSGRWTTSLRRLHATVGQRNRRDPSRVYVVMRRGDEVRVWLQHINE